MMNIYAIRYNVVMKKKILLAVLGALVALSTVGYLTYTKSENQTPQNNTQLNPQKDSEDIELQKSTKDFNKTRFSITDPDSIWVVVNKNRPLPDGYEPSDLIVPSVRLRLDSTNQQMKFRRAASGALQEMFTAADRAGVTLVFGSGYRSAALQKQFYDNYVAQDGQAAADRYSARPGTSEHQTGLSFDATNIRGECHLETCFKNTPEGKWLAQNAYKYGFIIRYPDGKEAVTGYQYEPWHMRYVGKELAAEMSRQNIVTLEEFFDL